MPLRTAEAAALAALLLIVNACGQAGLDQPRYGTTEQAEAIAGSWLAAVAGETQDRGWSLLYPSTQEALYASDPSSYTAEAEAISWTDFSWRLQAPTVWDGNYLVTLVLTGDKSPPALLAEGHLVQPFDSDDGSARAAITVRIDADGTSGILGP